MVNNLMTIKEAEHAKETTKQIFDMLQCQINVFNLKQRNDNQITYDTYSDFGFDLTYVISKSLKINITQQSCFGNEYKTVFPKWEFNAGKLINTETYPDGNAELWHEISGIPQEVTA